MTLRESLGGEVDRVHEIVDRLLDEEDCLIVLIGAERAISYGRGFGLSPCHLELVTTDIARTVRAMSGGPSPEGSRRDPASAHDATAGEHRAAC